MYVFVYSREIRAGQQIRIEWGFLVLRSSSGIMPSVSDVCLCIPVLSGG